MKTFLIQSGCNKVLLPLFFIILLIPTISSAQKKTIGSVDYLKSSNGFKDIILGTDISSITYLQSNYLDGDSRFDADSCLKFAVTDSNLLKINNNLALDMIGIRTYKNKIVNIYLFFRKADGYKMLSDLLTNYGVVFTKPDENKNIYNWDCKTINLCLLFEANTEDGVAIFTCNPLEQYMAEVKELVGIKARAKEIQASETWIHSKNTLSSTNPKAASGHIP